MAVELMGGGAAEVPPLEIFDLWLCQGREGPTFVLGQRDRCVWKRRGLRVWFIVARWSGLGGDRVV